MPNRRCSQDLQAEKRTPSDVKQSRAYSWGYISWCGGSSNDWRVESPSSADLQLERGCVRTRPKSVWIPLPSVLAPLEGLSKREHQLSVFSASTPNILRHGPLYKFAKDSQPTKLSLSSLIDLDSVLYKTVSLV